MIIKLYNFNFLDMNCYLKETIVRLSGYLICIHVCRRILYRPAYEETAELSLMTGVIKEYFKQLHTTGGLDRIVEIASDDVVYGGYRPEHFESIVTGKENFRNVYQGICANAPIKYSVS